MAAVGILAALRERDVSGEGQLVDASMFDGSLAWLAMVAARALAEGQAQRRGELELAGSLVCYRPYRCADGWVTMGALEPKFWATFCAGVGREDLVEKQFEKPGSEAHEEVEAIIAARTREEWAAFATEHPCCLEPVLELDEALESELVKAREMVVELDQPGAVEPVRLLGIPIKSSRTPGDANRLPGPGARRAHRRGAGRPGLRRRRDRRAARAGRGRRPADRARGIVPGMTASGTGVDGLLKMRELAEASGVSAGTIKHYLREGLLDGADRVVRTSRNMAYYPPDFVERIRLIKRLQEERFMPLGAIRKVLEEDPERAAALVEIEDRIIERAIAGAPARAGHAARSSSSATTSPSPCSTGSSRSAC